MKELIVEYLDKPVADIKCLKYNLIKAGNIYFLYSDDIPNKADFIFASNRDNKSGEGFGGRKITFNLYNGESFVLNGGWHTNSNHLFRLTGVDLRDKYYTRVIIAKDRKYDKGTLKLLEPLYIEDKFYVGRFKRSEILAQEQCEKHGLDKVIVYNESIGGSSNGYYYKDNPCASCDKTGIGKYTKNKCKVCNGTGYNPIGSY